MGRPLGGCTVCQHVERARIELALSSGVSRRATARKYGLNHNAVGRHWVNHISDERKANLVLGPVAREALAARVGEESTSVLDHYRVVRSGLYTLFTAAVEAGDGAAGAVIAGKLTNVLDSVARLTGELAGSPLVSNTTNIFMSPEFTQIEATLVRVLAKFPAARAEVLKAFRELANADDSEPEPTPPGRLLEHEQAVAP